MKVVSVSGSPYCTFSSLGTRSPLSKPCHGYFARHDSQQTIQFNPISKVHRAYCRVLLTLLILGLRGLTNTMLRPVSIVTLRCFLFLLSTGTAGRIVCKDENESIENDLPIRCFRCCFSCCSRSFFPRAFAFNVISQPGRGPKKGSGAWNRALLLECLGVSLLVRCHDQRFLLELSRP